MLTTMALNGEHIPPTADTAILLLLNKRQVKQPALARLTNINVIRITDKFLV